MVKIDAEILHSKLLHMMTEFHSFCQENNLKYYMIGGTALGAKRHKGFIPWDDDADIGMLRDDYEKLVSLADRLPKSLEIRFFRTAPESPMPYIKLIDPHTTLIERWYLNYVEGLYIDIFPLDGAKKPSFLERLRHKRIYFVFTLLGLKCKTDKEHGLKKIIQQLLKLVNKNLIQKRLDYLMRKISPNKSTYIANFLGAYGKAEVMMKECFSEPVLYEFEGLQFYGPKNIDEYLTNVYGDYLKLPPIENRKFKHSYHYLDFNTPYKEYIKKRSLK